MLPLQKVQSALMHQELETWNNEKKNHGMRAHQ